jgi:hypothetical protein
VTADGPRTTGTTGTTGTAGTTGTTAATASRVALGALGVGAGLWGLRLLLGLDLPDLFDAGLWLAGGVVLHDFVLAPIVLGLGVLLAARLPEPARVPAVVALVVVGLVTAAVLPTLGRFGAKSDDPYLLARPYTAWWLAFVAVAALVAVVAAAVGARHQHSSGRSPGPTRTGRPPRTGAAPGRRT